MFSKKNHVFKTLAIVLTVLTVFTAVSCSGNTKLPQEQEPQKIIQRVDVEPLTGPSSSKVSFLYAVNGDSIYLLEMDKTITFTLFSKNPLDGTWSRKDYDGLAVRNTEYRETTDPVQSPTSPDVLLKKSYTVLEIYDAGSVKDEILKPLIRAFEGYCITDAEIKEGYAFRIFDLADILQDDPDAKLTALTGIEWKNDVTDKFIGQFVSDYSTSTEEDDPGNLRLRVWVE